MKYFTLLIMALTSLAAPGWFKQLRSRLPRWNVLTNAQKVALVSFISLTVMLPIITLATLEGTRLASRANMPVTPPITPTPTQTQTSFEFFVTPISVGVKQDFVFSWIKYNSNYRVDFSTIVPPGIIIPGSIDGCATGVGCTYTNFLPNPSPKEGINLKAYPVKEGLFTFNTKFVEAVTGLTVNKSAILSVTTLSPTPTPQPNAIPVITTTSLPSGILNRQYTATIAGYDLDETDTLSLTVSGLPAGLRQDKCALSVVRSRAVITCTLTGRALKAGNYPVTIILTDNRGGKTSKVLSLRIIRTAENN